MKVGIFDPYLDTLGGGERYMLTAASCLAGKHEVEAFWDDPSILRKAEKRFALDLSDVKVAPNIFSASVSLLRRLLATQTYGAIIYLSDGSIPVTLAKKLILHFQFPVEWVDGKNLLTRIKLKRVDNILCNSKFTQSFIDRKFGVKSMLLYPPAIEEKRRLEDEGKKENMILTVGRFGKLVEGTNFKKQDVMIEVFKQMVDQRLKNWQLLLAISFLPRDRDEVEELEGSIKGYPIRIEKNLEHEEITKLYAKAKLYWHAAGFGEDVARNPHLAEHFGISTVEAMGGGVVPVVINAGGQSEIVDNDMNGFLWDTLEELKEKTLLLIHDEKLLNKLAKNAQEKAKRFSKERFCREIYELIET